MSIILWGRLTLLVSIFWLRVIIALLSIGLFGQPSLLAAPPVSIVIDHLPPCGSTESLSGKVLNASPGEQRVIVFIYVPGFGWVSKPACPQTLIPIAPDGTWSADITTGGSDSSATRVAAMVVSNTYSEACLSGNSVIPTNIYAASLARAVVSRSCIAPTLIRFAGYDWWVKSSVNQVGPGPNYFSSSSSNVWVDAEGWLHLRITNRNGEWQCAEIVSTRTFGYGIYRFEVGSDINAIDINTVLGLFTWSDDPAYTHRELDVECSRWSNAGDANDAQFVVQPFSSAGHLVRYRVPPLLMDTTHSFQWETNRVIFQSMRGPFNPVPGSNLISSWVYNQVPPASGDENVRLNLWLNNGAAPTSGHEVEVIIKNFQFSPLTDPARPQLTPLRKTGAGFGFAFPSEPDRRYEIFRSSDLADWQFLGTYNATNDLFSFSDTNSDSAASFYRVLALK